MANPPNPEDSNCGTLVLTGDQLQQRPHPLSFDRAWRAAYGELIAAVVATREAAVWLAAVDRYGRVVAQHVLRDGSMLTIGRHEQCSFRLTAPHISLRHLVANCRSTPEGGWSVRLWDLHTDVPFVTEDGNSTTAVSCAVSCEGPLFVALDEYALLFIPFPADAERFPADADDAWAGLSIRKFVDSRTQGPDNPIEPPHLPPVPPSQPPAIPPPHLPPIPRNPPPPPPVFPSGAIPRPQLPARPRQEDRSATIVEHLDAPMRFADAAARGDGWVEVGVEFDRVRISHSFSLEDLKRGLLFGRYARCDMSMHQLNEDGRLSRVHLFIVCIDDSIWAIDTASTNGTTCRGVRLGAIMLGSREQLLLAETTRLTWEVRAVGEA